MANSLHELFQAIAKAQNEQELRQAVMDKVGEYFGVQHWGIYLVDDHYTAEADVKVIPDVCLESNPVGQYVVERHAPAHEELVLPSGDWKNFCSRHDHEHVMSGPIVCEGRLVGSLNLTRASGDPAFDANDLADLSALCLHLSAKIATLQAQAKPKALNSLLANRLTPRELEIAALVAQGLTNAEIGEKLWITQNSVKQALKRMFRKLEVSARTEMVAKLQDVLASS
ncbi:transcriptional regulator [Scytonema hofmannii PCC 7110]|uniref:Transcriptional regulator n=1 Tax=Scytonema hofmannii PCC 7110 TaxID=128403 RepID=A0A139XFH4_9CYAN|nr:LuxR C-terminal-related transcriptional regulator [Scytonema hofmannii]KYC43438.1 transcriptional regulator [Scytonema hofmannii PCC 7110]